MFEEVDEPRIAYQPTETFTALPDNEMHDAKGVITASAKTPAFSVALFRFWPDDPMLSACQLPRVSARR